MELIESRVYTREQAADVLQVSIASIDRYIREGRLPAANLGDGRTIRITGKDIAAFIESCRPPGRGRRTENLHGSYAWR